MIQNRDSFVFNSAHFNCASALIYRNACTHNLAVMVNEQLTLRSEEASLHRLAMHPARDRHVPHGLHGDLTKQDQDA